jgi:hypothetical protein
MPLVFPLPAEAWDDDIGVVRFAAKDGDRGHDVRCAITAEALCSGFGSRTADGAGCLNAFGRNRLTIETLASRVFDERGGPRAFEITVRDLPESATAS